ncbi:hypothetical protein V5O48_018275 [Marasmius crinis-equi]|uniref:Uncharacterized protein n=1 Tax=Marasmius crinis-equi TaxID=585013 RepID=A0ABR3ELM8_9AGAR
MDTPLVIERSSSMIEQVASGSDVEMTDLMPPPTSTPHLVDSAKPAPRRVVLNEPTVAEIADTLTHNNIKVVDYAYLNPRLRTKKHTSTPTPTSLPLASLPIPFTHTCPKRDIAEFDYFIARGSAETNDDDTPTEPGDDDVATEAGSVTTIATIAATGSQSFYPDGNPPDSLLRPPTPGETELDMRLRFMYPERVDWPLRTDPICGALIWRLLEIGWITMEELRRVLLPIDWKALEEHKARMVLFKKDVEEALAQHNEQVFENLKDTNGKVDQNLYREKVAQQAESVLEFGLDGQGELGYPYRAHFKENTRQITLVPKSEKHDPTPVPYWFVSTEDHLLGVGRPPSKEYRRALRAHHALDVENRLRKLGVFQVKEEEGPSRGAATEQVAQKVTSWIRKSGAAGCMGVGRASPPAPVASSNRALELQISRPTREIPTRPSGRKLQRQAAMFFEGPGSNLRGGVAPPSSPASPSLLRSPLSPHPSFTNLGSSPSTSYPGNGEAKAVDPDVDMVLDEAQSCAGPSSTSHQVKRPAEGEPESELAGESRQPAFKRQKLMRH